MKTKFSIAASVMIALNCIGILSVSVRRNSFTVVGSQVHGCIR